MSRSLNLSLTDEMRAFVNEKSGDGTTYATPSEYLRSVLREKKDRDDAATLRRGVLEGYEDLIAGRVTEYDGDLSEMLRRYRGRGRGS